MELNVRVYDTHKTIKKYIQLKPLRAQRSIMKICFNYTMQSSLLNSPMSNAQSKAREDLGPTEITEHIFCRLNVPEIQVARYELAVFWNRINPDFTAITLCLRK